MDQNPGLRPGQGHGEDSATPGPAIPRAVDDGDAAPMLPESPEPGLRRATRSPDQGWLVGVAAGLARHLGIPVWIVRLGFIILTPFQLLGAMLYGALWILMPLDSGDASSPGIESATRLGLRRPDGPDGPGSRRPTGGTAAVVLIAIGLVLLVQTIGSGVTARWFWPLALAAGGVALVWRQAEDSASPLGPSDRPRRWYSPLLGGGRLVAAIRVGAGMAMVGSAVSLVAASQIGMGQWPTLVLMTVLVLAGAGLLSAPWVYSWRVRLRQADQERAVADARADMAAHLHDSVLQTLALIQREAEDPRAVATLARRQERELREWLYGGATATASGGTTAQAASPTTLKAALAAETSRIEAERGVPVELVCVGDTEVTESLQALVQASAEAVMNAAKHSRAAKVDVYAEVEPDRVEVFVRDRGVGFDPATIADDRMGVRRSIIERMERHGGSAHIRSADGEGTEIRLEMAS